MQQKMKALEQKWRRTLSFPLWGVIPTLHWMSSIYEGRICYRGLGIICSFISCKKIFLKWILIPNDSCYWIAGKNGRKMQHHITTERLIWIFLYLISLDIDECSLQFYFYNRELSSDLSLSVCICMHWLLSISSPGICIWHTKNPPSFPLKNFSLLSFVFVLEFASPFKWRLMTYALNVETRNL